MNNRDKFLSLMVDHELDRLDLAGMLKVKREQIDSWLAPPGTRHHEDIPDMALELLETKLKSGSDSQSADT
jgi:hypothetical protein